MLNPKEGIILSNTPHEQGLIFEADNHTALNLKSTLNPPLGIVNQGANHHMPKSIDLIVGGGVGIIAAQYAPTNEAALAMGLFFGLLTPLTAKIIYSRIKRHRT